MENTIKIGIGIGYINVESDLVIPTNVTWDTTVVTWDTTLVTWDSQ